MKNLLLPSEPVPVTNTWTLVSAESSVLQFEDPDCEEGSNPPCESVFSLNAEKILVRSHSHATPIRNSHIRNGFLTAETTRWSGNHKVLRHIRATAAWFIFYFLLMERLDREHREVKCFTFESNKLNVADVGLIKQSGTRPVPNKLKRFVDVFWFEASWASLFYTQLAVLALCVFVATPRSDNRVSTPWSRVLHHCYRVTNIQVQEVHNLSTKKLI